MGPRITGLCLVLAIAASAGCRVRNRPALFALSGLALAGGALITAGAPSCPMSPDDAELGDLIGEAGCKASRAMSISFGVSFIAAGLVALVVAAHAGPSAPATADGTRIAPSGTAIVRPVALAGAAPPIEERLLLRAHADARRRRCDRVRVIAGSLAARHREYHARVVVNDPILRSCLWP